MAANGTVCFNSLDSNNTIEHAKVYSMMHVMMPVTSMSNCRNKTDRRGCVCCDGLLHPRHTSGYFSSTWAQHTTHGCSRRRTIRLDRARIIDTWQTRYRTMYPQQPTNTHTLKTLIVVVTLCNTKKTILTLSIGWLSEHWGLYAFLGREHIPFLSMGS